MTAHDRDRYVYGVPAIWLADKKTAEADREKIARVEEFIARNQKRMEANP
jgi:hypothetical protein